MSDVASAGPTTSHGGADGLRREFTLRSTFSLAFAFISPIIALYTIFALSLQASGPAFWWGFVVVLAGQLLVAFVLAELASACPLAGGLYQWSRRLVGNTYGWFAAWAYLATLVVIATATAYAAAPFLAELIGANAESNWTLVLLSLVVLAAATLANMIGRGVLKVFITLSIAAELIGSVVIGTVLLLFYRVNSIGVIFDNFGTTEGLYIAGPFLTGVAFIGWAFVGFDAATDVAEECNEPERSVPKAVVYSLLGVAAIVMYAGLALILAIPDLEGAVAGNGGDPIIATLSTHLGAAVAKPLFAIIVVGFTAGIVAIQAALSRLVFALSRDRLLPAVDFLGRLSEGERLPLNAILAGGAVSASLLAVSFSDSAYGAFIGTATVGFYVAFAFPVFAALYARRRGALRFGPYSLGRYGGAVTTAAAVWLVFEIVNIAWPRGACGARSRWSC